jgi:hypothetical protein
MTGEEIGVLINIPDLLTLSTTKTYMVCHVEIPANTENIFYHQTSRFRADNIIAA